MFTRRHAIVGALAGAASSRAGFTRPAFAQTLNKPAQMIVGFAAGGGTDVSARLFGERLRGVYAPSVIVENKVGAAGRVGVEVVKNGPQDGSIMLFTPDFPVTLYPHIFKKLNYDPLKDLIPVAPVTKSVLVYSIGPAVPKEVITMKAFIDWCRANPDKASYATTGAGGTPHFVGVMVANAAKIAMAPVHYRGGGPAMQDLIGGHIAASINPSSEAMPLAQDGKCRILAVASPQRSRFMPDIPTMREQGLDIALDTWTGVLLPAGVPAPIVTALSAALEKAVKTPELIEAQAKFGNEMTFMPQAEFAAQMQRDIERWAPIVKASGFVPEE